MKKLSIVTPCFNEEEGIAQCVTAIRDLFSKDLINYDYEHILIDNNSTDSTVQILRTLAEDDKRLKIIVNSRNFGLSRSPYHAFLQATGDAVIPIVADLQTPVDVIPKLVREWEIGKDLVFASRRSMQVSFIQRMFRNVYYRLLRAVGASDHVPHFIGFGLFDKKVVNILAGFGDSVPYMRGSLSEVGFSRSIIEYDEPPRAHGKSRHGFFDRVELASLGLTVSSSRPIYVLILVGTMTALLTLSSALIYAVLKILYWKNFDVGIAPILILTSLVGSIQLISIGVLGLYVEVILRHVRPRPLVIEKERINFPDF
jgi:glycosyltransferase involved in cell wall biosynthesis